MFATATKIITTKPAALCGTVVVVRLA